MTDAITRPLAQLMAALSGMDVPGCAAAIHEARHLAPPDQLAHAVIAYAMRRDVRTPALLAQDGLHWRTGRTPDTRVKPARCDVYGHEGERLPCRLCPVEAFDPTTTPTLTLTEEQAALNTEGARLVRAALTAHNRGEQP